MTTYLPKDVTDGLHAARKQDMARKSRLRVEADGRSFAVLRRWQGGFAVDASVVPPLRGLVDLFEGSSPIASCLIIAAEAEDGEMHYEFKRATAMRHSAPLDFQKDDDAPVALIGQ
ncbi:hypothetical protein [Pseudooceanicola algae]|uniref:Uncharacterized protein n=1 Tax=Pseudooceanicola algae TaxID=1537215 RepID=A0A418SKM4_9RHOB|nr:hypothetical protein [Pseudooceanicola algae]QPM91026.1 hypothetical protein PSAL_022690 [Pseudooceanicola algae]